MKLVLRFGLGQSYGFRVQRWEMLYMRTQFNANLMICVYDWEATVLWFLSNAAAAQTATATAQSFERVTAQGSNKALY